MWYMKFSTKLVKLLGYEKETTTQTLTTNSMFFPPVTSFVVHIQLHKLIMCLSVYMWTRQNSAFKSNGGTFIHNIFIDISNVLFCGSKQSNVICLLICMWFGMDFPVMLLSLHMSNARKKNQRLNTSITYELLHINICNVSGIASVI